MRGPMPRKTVLVTIAATLAVLAAGASAVAAGFLWGGWYSVAGTEQHFQPVFSALEQAMRQSVRLRARDIQAPELGSEALARRGASCFREHCVQCHGAPGVAPDAIGKSMQPLPGPLVAAAAHWRARELYWITRNGIRMTGMPSWERRLSDDELWSLVAFMQRLPSLAPRDYAAWQQEAAAPGCGTEEAAAPRPGDPRRGEEALFHYACRSCHVIPGATGAEVHVGPSLAAMGRRTSIAGVLPNTPANMERWLREPQRVKPFTAMPELGLSAQDARDIAAFLATLR